MTYGRPVERGPGHDNVAIVKALYEAFRTGDNVTPFELFDRDIVWRMVPADFADLEPVYYGHEGVREFWRGWLSAWETIEFDLVSVEEIESDVVLVEVQQVNRGRASGVEIPYHWFQAWRLRAGRVIGSYGALDREEALTLAGVEPA